MAKSRRICDRAIQTCPACRGLGWAPPGTRRVDAWPTECDVCRGPGVITIGWVANYTGINERLVGRIVAGKAWRAKGKLDAVLDKLQEMAACLSGFPSWVKPGSHVRA